LSTSPSDDLCFITIALGLTVLDSSQLKKVFLFFMA
jgi:hypothetical protein